MPRKIHSDNTDFNTDTDSLGIPKGTTGQRDAPSNSGAIRHNTTEGGIEQWTGSAWSVIYPDPVITSVTSSTVGLNEDDNATITITGSSLSKVNKVEFLNNSGGAVLSTAGTVTVVSSTSVTATYAASDFTAGQVVDIKISTSTNQTATDEQAFTISADPVWQTSAGSLGTVADGSRSGFSTTVTATTSDSVAVQYELASGSLPAGASLNAITGVISGNLTVVGSSTTSTFTLTAVAQTSDSSVRRTDRQFTITVTPPVVSFTNSGSLGTLANYARSSDNLTSGDCGATITSGSVGSFTITSGSLPGGLSLDSSNGNITGTANAVGSNTTSNFTVQLTASGDFTSFTQTEDFSIVVNGPTRTTYSNSTSFNAPAGMTSLDVLVVAGGGGGGSAGQNLNSEKAGGGGGGGLIYRPGFPVSAGSNYTVTVGNGGTNPGIKTTGNIGGNSVFGTLTAIGGGRSNGGYAGGNLNGGSGGGAKGHGSHGNAEQPGRPGDSGTYGFGHPGGGSSGQQPGGGGGAGGGGSRPNGGSGRTYSISGSSVTYAGGGGGYGGSGSGGGGSYNGGGGTGNRGGGGGGGHNQGGGSGGKGIVVISY